MYAVDKRKNFFSLLLVAIVIISIVFGAFTLSVSAADTSIADNYNLDLIEGNVSKGAFKWALFVYGGGMLQDVEDILSFDFADTSSSASTLWVTAEDLYNVFAGVGIGVCVVFCLLSLLNKVQADNFNLEHFFKEILKLFVSILIISNGLSLLRGGVVFANKILQSLTNYSTEGSSTANATILNGYYEEAKKIPGGLRGALKDAAFGLGLYCELLIPYLGCNIAKIVISFTCYSRVIEIVARAIFAPIGMASILDGGLNSSGFRYFKKFVAVCLQGAVISAIITIYNSYASAIVITGDGNALTQLIMTFVVMSLIMKAQSWANDIVGV